jgi:hypothetical protein
MKWARDIDQFIAREREKFSAAQARRRPDRNVCCKCAYDLAGVAEPPPTPAPPDLKCPECGAPVSLRDHWRTDGRYSMKRLLTVAWLICMAPLAVSIITVALRPADGSSTNAFEWYFVLLMAGWVIGQVALFALAVVISHLGMKGVALRGHLLPRFTAIIIPVVVVVVLGQILRWIAS